MGGDTASFAAKQRFAQSKLETERLVAVHGSVNAAAKASGIPRKTLEHRLKKRTEELEYPDFGSKEPSAEELIETAKADYARNRAFHQAQHWFPIKVKTDLPIGVAFVGDPHVDSPGCDWVTLDRDLRLIASTDGMYGVNGGDLTDNWVGRLSRLYADSNVSKTRAAILSEKVLTGYGVPWLAHLLGNHDLWSPEQCALIKRMAGAEVPVLDWQARFQIHFANKRVCRTWVAHSFPGTSIYNLLHGNQRAALMRDEAHLYISNHKHDTALAQGEDPATGRVYWLGMARGYKALDCHANQLGYDSKKSGATIVAIIDPRQPEGPRFVHLYSDLEEAADILAWKRARV